VQVAVGCGDTQASTVGAGVVGEPTVVYIAGSTDCVTIPMQSPTTDLRWINAGHVVPDRWLGIGSTSAAGASVDWFVRHFLPGADGHERMVRLAKGASTDVPPVLYLPYLAGERTPLWDPQATGVFFGLTASAGLEHLARGVFEGTAFALRDVITCLEEITPEGVGDIVAAGGGARNGFWNQVKANALQKPLRVCDTGESGCKAAALLAGVGSGVFPSVEQAAESVRATLTYHAVEPDECFADYYDGLFDAYQSLYRNTRELMHRIPQLRNPIRDGGDG
jgi:xylulokinase